ncbi:hypothetical protein [Nonomuraea sp. NPDC023979]|uniref:hypothetical protein n=1 Tax=Nonomuraea sp. NPDC023979 TaxID=3154796 RepID=UPI003406514A
MSKPTRALTPDIGDTFTRDGRSYRVTGWLKRSERTGALARRLGPDSCPLQFCARDEAQYVSGYGICGVIVRVGDVVVTGRVPWTEDALASDRALAARLAGQRVY